MLLRFMMSKNTHTMMFQTCYLKKAIDWRKISMYCTGIVCNVTQASEEGSGFNAQEQRLRAMMALILSKSLPLKRIGTCVLAFSVVLLEQVA